MKIEFDSNNKVKSSYDFPKLYLDYNERARIVAVEPAPELEWVHTLRAPQIINGEVVMEKVKQKDNSIVDKPKMDFIGKHLCFGNPETLKDNDKDPKNCPTCAAAQQDDSVGRATRRYAMHVVQYRTQPGSHKVQQPFQAELVVWAFTDRVFNQLIDIAEEHGDLRQRDLLLGPCENKNFQNFDIQVGGSAEWLANEDNKKFVQTLYQQNKLDDLSPAIGRRLNREQAQDDIDKVKMRNAQAFGGASERPADAGASAGTGMDLESLLEGPDESQSSTPEPEATPEPEPTPEPTPEPEGEQKKESKTLDFDSLLEGI